MGFLSAIFAAIFALGLVVIRVLPEAYNPQSRTDRAVRDTALYIQLAAKKDISGMKNVFGNDGITFGPIDEKSQFCTPEKMEKICFIKSWQDQTKNFDYFYNELNLKNYAGFSTIDTFYQKSGDRYLFGPKVWIKAKIRYKDNTDKPVLLSVFNNKDLQVAYEK